MSDAKTDDLKTGTFDTWVRIEQRRAADAVVQIKVDDKAATRQAIIAALRREGVTFLSRSDWKAKPSQRSDGPDWNFHAIALHHAGNSYSCSADGADQLRKAEATDIASFGHVSYHYAIACDGMLYEALDIREKGAHIASGNTGVIGIVMLADMSLPGEAYREEYAKKSLLGKVRGAVEWGADELSSSPSRPSETQVKSLTALVKVLRRYFTIDTLGGHREFQQIQTGDGRACPGAYGMELVDRLRAELRIGAPKK